MENARLKVTAECKFRSKTWLSKDAPEDVKGGSQFVPYGSYTGCPGLESAVGKTLDFTRRSEFSSGKLGLEFNHFWQYPGHPVDAQGHEMWWLISEKLIILCEEAKPAPSK